LSRSEAAEMRKADCPRSVPWRFVERHEAQVVDNHEQPLERIAERGGLSPAEIVAAARGQRLGRYFRMTDVGAAPELVSLLREYEREVSDV
jgi:hypothetical protein